MATPSYSGLQISVLSRAYVSDPKHNLLAMISQRIHTEVLICPSHYFGLCLHASILRVPFVSHLRARERTDLH